MTDEQAEMVAGLRRCIFLPASFEKRFVNDMTYQADKELTPRQDWFLRRTYYRYRKQIGHKGEMPNDYDSPPAPVRKPKVEKVEIGIADGAFICYAPVSPESVAADEAERLRAWNAGQPRKV